MLVLTRKSNQQIVIGKDIVLTVLEIRGDRVRLGIAAPASTPVHRAEIWQRIQSEGRTGISPISPAAGNNSELYAEYV